jgi:transposase
MNGYSEDLRQRIVSAIERGISKTQAARTFDVSLSSVKRYMKKANHGESLAKGSERPLFQVRLQELHSSVKRKFNFGEFTFHALG